MTKSNQILGWLCHCERCIRQGVHPVSYRSFLKITAQIEQSSD